MNDWIGLGFIVLVLLGALVGLSHLGREPEPLTQEEYERRVAEGRGWMSAGAMAGINALHKLVNPKAAEAIEVQKDLRAGYYDDHEEEGEGDEPGRGGAGAEPSSRGPKLTDGEGDNV